MEYLTKFEFLIFRFSLVISRKRHNSIANIAALLLDDNNPMNKIKSRGMFEILKSIFFHQ